MKRTDRADTEERLARIDQLIEKHRAARRRQLLRRVLKLRHRAEAYRQLAALEVPPERVH